MVSGLLDYLHFYIVIYTGNFIEEEQGSHVNRHWGRSAWSPKLCLPVSWNKHCNKFSDARTRWLSSNNYKQPLQYSNSMPLLLASMTLLQANILQNYSESLLSHQISLPQIIKQSPDHSLYRLLPVLQNLFKIVQAAALCSINKWTPKNPHRTDSFAYSKLDTLVGVVSRNCYIESLMMDQQYTSSSNSCLQNFEKLPMQHNKHH